MKILFSFLFIITYQLNSAFASNTEFLFEIQDGKPGAKVALQKAKKSKGNRKQTKPAPAKFILYQEYIEDQESGIDSTIEIDSDEFEQISPKECGTGLVDPLMKTTVYDHPVSILPCEKVECALFQTPGNKSNFYIYAYQKQSGVKSYIKILGTPAQLTFYDNEMVDFGSIQKLIPKNTQKCKIRYRLLHYKPFYLKRKVKLFLWFDAIEVLEEGSTKWSVQYRNATPIPISSLQMSIIKKQYAASGKSDLMKQLCTRGTM